MTPQLQQAIKLLQLSDLELADYCEAELEKNPILERDEAPAHARPNPKTSDVKPPSERPRRPDARGFFQSRGTGSVGA